jgi:hypothetical protein
MSACSRQSTITHYERACGRCPDRAAAVDGVYTALVEGQAVPELGCEIPSTHRWGSASRAFSEQSLGMFVHNITDQLFQTVFHGFRAADAFTERAFVVRHRVVHVSITLTNARTSTGQPFLAGWRGMGGAASGVPNFGSRSCRCVHDLSPFDRKL